MGPLSAGPFVLPPVRGPELVIVNQSFSWIPTAVSFLQFLALFALTVYTFRSGARQKVREREAAWYHKVVVDPLVPRLDQFFSEGLSTLHSAADVAYRDRLAGTQEASAELKAKITEFRHGLLEAASEVSRRLEPFGESTARWAADTFEDLENVVTRWFDEQLIAKPYQKREDLERIFLDRHSKLLRGLMRFEFDRWGWPHGGLR